MGIALRYSKRTDEQTFEVLLHLKCFSIRRARKSRGIENDGIESFASPDKPRQHRSHVIRYEMVTDRRQVVQREIFATASQIIFGEINVESARSAACRANRERARIGKTI